MVTAIKVMDGQFENDMAYLNNSWRSSLQAAKEAGIVTSFHVYEAQARDPTEADLYLVVAYPNMAASMASTRRWMQSPPMSPR